MANILNQRDLEYYVKDWLLVPATGGLFELEVDGELLFSKKQLGRHAEEGEVEALFAELVEKYRQENGLTAE